MGVIKETINGNMITKIDLKILRSITLDGIMGARKLCTPLTQTTAKIMSVTSTTGLKTGKGNKMARDDGPLLVIMDPVSLASNGSRLKIL